MARQPIWTRQAELTLIGLGAVGTSLAKSLSRTKWAAFATVGRGRPGERRITRALNIDFYDSIFNIRQNHGIIIIAVRDAQLDDVVRDLCGLKLPWQRFTVLHTSGALSADPLRPLARRGAAVAAWHPFQTFPKGGGEAVLNGIFFGIEGNPRGIAAASRLTRVLGGNPVRVPAKLRALYHASAVFASGFVTANLQIAVDLLSKCGLSERQARAAAIAIARETLGNVERFGPRQALTGPAARGDAATVKKHLAALKAIAPEWLATYKALSKSS